MFLKVKLQLLQTLSMLVQNIRRQTSEPELAASHVKMRSVYYILSNNHVNRLMVLALRTGCMWPR